MRTGAVRFPAVCDGGVEVSDTILVGEGLETILSVRTALPHLPVAAALTASNLRAFEPPEGLRTLWIAQDADGPGDRAAKALAERLSREAPSLSVERLVPERGDFNDMLRAMGPRQLARWLRERMRTS